MGNVILHCDDKQASPWLTRAEAARYLRVDPTTIDRWARDGRISRYKIEGLQSVRFRCADIDALVVPTQTPG